MGLDIKTLAASKKYTKTTATGGGAIQGKPGKDGKDAPTITSVDVDENNVLLTTLSDGTTLNGGTIKTVSGVDGVDGQNGENGITPHIDITTKHWFVGDTDTGIVAEGKDGIQGIKGDKGNTGAQGIQGIQGIKGDKGDDGYPFLIYKEYTSLDNFSASDFPEIGLMFMIKAENTTTLPVYRYTGEAGNPYSFVTNLSGSEGIKGDKGDPGKDGEQGVAGQNGKDGTTYSPTIGTVVSLDSNQNATASVAIDEDTKIAKFNFGIPKGTDGFSPIISVEKIDSGHKVYLIDSTHTEEFIVLDGNNCCNKCGKKLEEPTEVILTNNDESVLIQWADPEDILSDNEETIEWNGTIVVRKLGSAPTSVSDGVVVVDSKIRNQYKDSGFLDTGLTNGNCYYYGIFPYTTENIFTTTLCVEITPSEIYPPAVTDVIVKPLDSGFCVTFDIDDVITNVKCVYKNGEIPKNNNDGIVVNNFSSGNSIKGLENGTIYYLKIYSYNMKNRETSSNAFNVTPELHISSFSDATDEEIESLLNAHYLNKIDISDYWSLGDVRSLELNGVKSDFIIIGFNHDELTNPINGHTNAALSIRALNSCKSVRIADSQSNKCGWSGSHIRMNEFNSIIDWFPQSFRKLIKSVEKKTSLGNKSTEIGITSDKLWLISEVEFFGSNLKTIPGEGVQYEYYKNESSRIGGNVSTWLRSPYKVSALYFTTIFYKSNIPEVGTQDPRNGCGIVMGLCL